MRTIKHIVTAKTRQMIAVRWVALAILLSSIFLILTLPAFAQTKYVITDGDNVIVCLSNSTDPQVVIKEAGLDAAKVNVNGGALATGIVSITLVMSGIKHGDVAAEENQPGKSNQCHILCPV